MYRRRTSLALLFLSAFFLSQESFALLTTETTLSTGFYRDVEQRARIPALFYWTVHHIPNNRFAETIIDLGVNNDVNPAGAWRVYLYGARIEVPVGNGRVLLGRQLLTEGFELATFDGVQIPYQLTPKLTLTPVAGLTSTVDNLEPQDRTRAIGASLSGTFGKIDWKAGYLNKRKNPATLANLVNLGALRDFESLPGAPTLFGRAQWDFTAKSFDQGLVELQLNPMPHLQMSLAYSDRKPNAADTASQDWIYRLFAMSSRKNFGASASWEINRVLTAHASVQEYRFTSIAKADSANEQQLSLAYRLRGATLEPFFAHIASYGGEVFQAGAKAYVPMSDHLDLRGLVDVAKIDKLNGISGWAHHARAGMGVRMSSRFLAQAIVEVERNHRFELEARAIAYVSHFYY